MEEPMKGFRLHDANIYYLALSHVPLESNQEYIRHPERHKLLKNLKMRIEVNDVGRRFFNHMLISFAEYFIQSNLTMQQIHSINTCKDKRISIYSDE